MSDDMWPEQPVSREVVEDEAERNHQDYEEQDREEAESKADLQASIEEDRFQQEQTDIA